MVEIWQRGRTALIFHAVYSSSNVVGDLHFHSIWGMENPGTPGAVPQVMAGIYGC